jgi:hypothetical protein
MQQDRFDYGMLPPKTFKKILAAILDRNARARLKIVARTD